MGYRKLVNHPKMSVTKLINKYFATDQMEVPKVEKVMSYLIFGYILLIQYMQHLIYINLLPRRFYLDRQVRALQIQPLQQPKMAIPLDQIMESQKLNQQSSEQNTSIESDQSKKNADKKSMQKQNNKSASEMTQKELEYLDESLGELRLCYNVVAEKTTAGYQHEANTSRYKSVLSSYAALYNLTAYCRYKRCFHREACSVPGSVVKLRNEKNELISAVNTCSYNYLGLSTTNFDPQPLIDDIKKYGVGMYINRSIQDAQILRDLEKKVAQFLNQEEAVIHVVGYETNAMALPALIEPDWVILSDTFNHNSIVRGAQYSGCRTILFDHQRLQTLEKQLLELRIAEQHPAEKTLVILEGMYSMEGSYVDLPAVIQLKRKYGFVLFVDEAHSIGAVGATGRGVREHFQLPPECVDLYMGTFTKSFSSIGGYVAGRSDIIRKLKSRALFYNSPQNYCPAFATQIIRSLDFIDTEAGAQTLKKLAENARHLRGALKSAHLSVLGDEASPVIPVLFYNAAKLRYASTELLRRRIASVVVGFPAVPLLLARVRLCVSASHTREQLDYIAAHIDAIADMMWMRQNSSVFGFRRKQTSEKSMTTTQLDTMQ